VEKNTGRKTLYLVVLARFF